MAMDNDDAVGLFHKALDAIGKDFRGLKIAELGNQYVKGWGAGRTSAKQLFVLTGAEHVSFDLNGRSGARQVDLGEPLVDETLYEHFDVVTNYGTSEHVASNDLAQFYCFRNIDYLCRVGGVIVCYVPAVDCSRHGAYHYTPEFFRSLALGQGYRTIEIEQVKKRSARIRNEADQNDHYMAVVFVKQHPHVFRKRDFPRIGRHNAATRSMT
jgi:hypothetical protein